MMTTKIPRLLCIATLCVFANSCASTSQSSGSNATPVFVSESAPPATISAEYIGPVAASDVVGYRKCATLYGALANQARSMGGNAVFYAGGDRRVTLLSWSAPAARGKAYRLPNLSSLSEVPGTMFGSSTTKVSQRPTTPQRRSSSSQEESVGLGQTHYLPGVE